ncbi:MAG: hypothetical protein AAGF85_07450 [Bacteroidota bacterium]
MLKFSADRIVSISAIVISLMTLVILVLQTTMIREQQQNSVFPYLMIGNEGYGMSDFKFVLTNNGIGPAIIESVEIAYLDSLYYMDLPSFLYENVDSMDTLNDVLHSNFYPGMLIPAEKKINILQVDNNKSESIALIQILQALELEMTVTYKSIYGQRWELSTNEGLPVSLD